MMKQGCICTALVLSLFVLQIGLVQANGTAISTCAGLQDINSNLSGNYYLANDINCEGFDFGDGSGFMPIGDDDTPFAGTFDGKGFTISKLSINRPLRTYYVGLFGFAGLKDGSASVSISNVNLTGLDITGNSHVGGLFGQLYYGNVTDVHSEGTIQGVAVLGVLGGDARYSTITQTSSSGLVDGYNGGNLSRIFYGGLIGGNEKTDLSCSSSDAEVIGNYRVGGLVGHNDGTISSSFATGRVQGVYRVGGLAGENIGGTISDTFATGEVSGSHEVAGLVGLQYESAAIIERSYATGTATGGVNTRGLLGMKMGGTCSSTFWDVTTSGVTSDSCGSVGLTTDEMQDQITYVGWDFNDTWTMGGYPVLQCSPDSGDTCTFSLEENDAIIFDGTGAEFGNDPAASFPTFTPTVSGTSLQFAATDGIGKQVYVNYPLVSAGTISTTTADVTFTVSIDTSAYGNDSDIFVGITDGTNVLWTAYTNQYNEIPPGVYVASTILNGNIVQAINPPTVLLPSSPNLPWQVKFTLSDASSNIATSVDSKCWTGDLDVLDRSAGLELLIGMGGGGFDWIQIDTLKLTADIPPVIDTDNDGVPDAVDNCPNIVNAGQENVDNDSFGDVCDACLADSENDADGDLICESDDNCPTAANPLQEDTDADGVGNACNEGEDSDGDEWNNALDNCPNDANADQADGDNDGFGDPCDVCPVNPENDADGDGICESVDNCPTVANSNQSNMDGDSYGDACEPDNDNDGVMDDSDNCPLDVNAGQEDYDNDGIGDICDADTDGDIVIDAIDQCLGTALNTPALANGCSVDQECVCDAAWKNHGAYVRCNTHACESLVDAGLLTDDEKDAIVSAAAQSDCGNKK